MKKINRIMMQEANMLEEILKKEYSYREEEFSTYHLQMIDSYEGIKQCIYGITNFNGNNAEEFVFYIANANLTDEQIESLAALRGRPIYIKAMGEAALLHKKSVEDALDYKIHNKGMVFPINRQAVKIEEQLKEEGYLLDSKLNELVIEGKIDEKKEERLRELLFYIFQYYQSIARGEQIPFKKFSNSFYQKIDRLAQKRGISFAAQYQQSLQNLRFQFEDLQNQQDNCYVENKKTDSK